VSKAGEIRTLPKTSLPVAVLRVAKGRIPYEPDRVKAYVFHITALAIFVVVERSFGLGDLIKMTDAPPVVTLDLVCRSNPQHCRLDELDKYQRVRSHGSASKFVVESSFLGVPSLSQLFVCSFTSRLHPS
jgi:hypothetical protein